MVKALTALRREAVEEVGAHRNASTQNGASQSGPAVSTAAAERPASDEGQPGPNRPIDAQPPQVRPASPLANRLAEVDTEEEFRGETVTTTVREALRDAMVEEMRRDPSVFLMGEEGIGRAHV